MTDIVKQLRQKPPVYETCPEAADIEADYAEMARQKTEKLAKVLRLARGELIAMMLRAQPNADTERVVDLLTDTLEGLK
jgi:hypothetical protein